MNYFQTVAFLFLWGMVSSYKPITDAQRMGLKGKVQSINEIMIYAEPDYNLKETFYFDEKGNLTRRQFYEYYIDTDENTTEMEGDYENYKIVSPELTTYSISDRGRVTKEGEIVRIGEYKFIRKENEFGTYQQEITSEYNPKWELIKLHRKAMVRGDSVNVMMTYKYKKGELKSIQTFDCLKNEKERLEIKNHQYDTYGNVIFMEYHKNGKLLYTSICEIEYY